MRFPRSLTVQSACLAAFALLFVTLASTVNSGESSETRAQYKASLIIKLLEYVSWPDGAGPEKDKPIIIGVLEDATLHSKLEQVAGFSAMDPKPQVKTVTDGAEMSDFHVICISAEDADGAKSALAMTAGSKILTLGDGSGLADAGVMVNFIPEAEATGKEKFEVNLGAVTGAGMKISSKFLKLAKIVNDGGSLAADN